jgi:hypothetical protein
MLDVNENMRKHERKNNLEGEADRIAKMLFPNGILQKIRKVKKI